MSAGRLTRLFPGPGGATRSPQDAYGELGLNALAREDRPFVIVNMVSTVDGQGRIDGDTSELGNETDLELFLTLREQVDCVMAGVHTVAIENYKGPAAKPETRERRQRQGFAARPIFATATVSGNLPFDAPLFQDDGARIVVFSRASIDTTPARASIEIVPTEDPREMLSTLRHDHGVRSLLLEGGPTINTPFFSGELVDELFLTLAPVLTGAGTPFPIIAGDLPRQQRLHLIGALLSEEHLFLRYRVD
ncbi:MAG: dihydrofolate reductase family protein [Solirubrobacterales bacterium]